MNKFCLRYMLALCLTAALLGTALTGCGAKTAGQETAEPAAASAESAPAATPAAESAPPAPPTAVAGPAESAPPASPSAEAGPAAEDGAVRVRSVEELLEAIRPEANIILAPGRYNLTEFLAKYPNPQDFDAWNEAHPYVRINEVYDGLELVVRDVTDLRVEGGSEDPAATELVVEPRYATVLGFQDCAGIELGCLTMGHTDGGDCSGNVLDFRRCQTIRLRSLDLYGCGANGISAMEGCGDMQVSNSTIRDCTYGPFEIDGGTGEFRFTACTLSGSGTGGSYFPSESSSLSFVGCSFGERESNRWYFDDSVKCEDCRWSEITEYPDIEYPDAEP